MTPAGKRKERLTFEQRGLDANGDRLGSWAEEFKRWGRVVSRTRGEAALEQRLQGLQPAELTVLRDSGTREITTAWRLLWNGKSFNILAVAPSEDGREINILAQGDQTDG